MSFISESDVPADTRRHTHIHTHTCAKVHAHTAQG